MASFTYIESSPFNYGGFAQYLFNSCPNVRLEKDGGIGRHTLSSAIQVELNVDNSTAMGIIKQFESLGFIKGYSPYHGSGTYLYYQK